MGELLRYEPTRPESQSENGQQSGNPGAEEGVLKYKLQKK